MFLFKMDDLLHRILEETAIFPYLCEFFRGLRYSIFKSGLNYSLGWSCERSEEVSSGLSIWTNVSKVGEVFPSTLDRAKVNLTSFV